MLFENQQQCQQSPARLSYDQACIDLINQINDNITIYGQYEECHKCNFQKYTVLGPFVNKTLLVDTRSPLSLHWTQNGTDYCRLVCIQPSSTRAVNALVVLPNCSTSTTITDGISRIAAPGCILKKLQTTHIYLY